MKPGLLRLLIRWASITASLSALLLLAAGTTHIASIRHYLAIFSAMLLVTQFSTCRLRFVEQRCSHLLSAALCKPGQ